MIHFETTLKPHVIFHSLMMEQNILNAPIKIMIVFGALLRSTLMAIIFQINGETAMTVNMTFLLVGTGKMKSNV